MATGLEYTAVIIIKHFIKRVYAYHRQIDGFPSSPRCDTIDMPLQLHPI